MANITIRVGGTAGAANRDQPGTLAGLQAAWAAIPTDVVASGNSYIIEMYNDAEFILGSQWVLSGKTTDASHTIAVRTAVGHSFADNQNVLTNALIYNQANGVAIRSTLSYADAISVNQANVLVWGLQIKRTGNGGGAGISLQKGGIIDRCLIDAPTSSSGTNVRGISLVASTARNNLVVLGGQTSCGIYFVVATAGDYSISENNTVVRKASVTGGASLGFSGDSTSHSVFNCAAFNTTFSDKVFAGTGNSGVGISNNASDGAITFGTSNKPNLVYANQFIDTNTDFRTKAGADLIDAGKAPSAGNTQTISGTRQQGASADIGAWEYPSVVQAPTATITAITVTGTTVKIDGTFTGGATSGFATLTKTAITGNNAADKPQQNLTLDTGAGTFTVSFTGCRIGRYDVVAKVSNTNYTNVQAANALGGANVTGPLALSVVQDPIDGQVYTLHGTCVNAVSGNLTLPSAATNPNGAAQQSLALTINTGASPNTYTVTATLAAGNYDAGILTFTNADGTSLPQAGTSAVTVMGFSGNPEAPPGPAGINLIAAQTSQANASSTGVMSVAVRSVTIQMVNRSGAPVASLAGLKWAWFDQASPDLFGAPTDKGAVETTDVSGQITVTLPNSGLAPGGTGWLIVTDSDGNIATIHKAFSGPAVVS